MASIDSNPTPAQAPYAVDFKGRTVLHCAASKNNPAAVERVLELCDDRARHARDKDGLTPTQLAYRHKAFDAARLFGSTEPADSCPVGRGGSEVRGLRSPPSKRTVGRIIAADIHSRARYGLFGPGYWIASAWGLLCCVVLLTALL